MKQPKSLGSLFDLGFPIHSRVGQKAASQHLDRFAERAGTRAGKVLHYFNSELGELNSAYIDRSYNAIADPIQQLDQISGATSVRQVAVRSSADMQLALIKARTDQRKALGPLGAIAPPQGTLTLTPVPFPGTNGTPKPSSVPILPVPRPPEPIPCPRCGFNVFVFNCPAPTINLSCPACKCNATCQLDVTYISTVVVQVINNLLQRLNVNVNVSQSLVNQIVQQVIVNLPPPAPIPEPPPPTEQLGRDCGHAIHVCLCGPPSDPVCLGSDVQHPLFICQVIPAPALPSCPAP